MVIKRKPHTEETKRKIGLANKGTWIKYNCDYCAKPSERQEAQFNQAKNHFCSHKCYSEFLKGRTSLKKGKKYIQHCGKNNSMWKGKSASYYTFHNWLRKHFGFPKQCEHCGILPEDYRTNKGLSSKLYPIEFALTKGKEHDHKRENYICLCVNCHRKYDLKN